MLQAETFTDKDQNDNQVRPIYEKVPIFKDYRISQPIKGSLLWGPIGFGSGYIGSTLYLNRNKDKIKWNLKAASGIGWEVSKISMIIGTIHGMYVGFRAENMKKDNPSFLLNKDKMGYEASLMLDPIVSSDAVTNKINSSIKITIDHEYRFINEFQICYSWVRWPELEDSHHVYEESKFSLMGNHYYRKGRVFSPFYGIGGGISLGKRRHDEWYFDDTKTVSQGYYPSISTAMGIRLSMMDLFYLKVEANYELSTFYFFARSHEKYSFATNLMFGLVIGAKVF